MGQTIRGGHITGCGYIIKINSVYLNYQHKGWLNELSFNYLRADTHS